MIGTDGPNPGPFGSLVVFVDCMEQVFLDVRCFDALVERQVWRDRDRERER